MSSFLSPGFSYLPLCVHLQNVHHIDHNVLVGLLVFSHSEGHGEPAGSTGTHVGPTAVLPPLTYLCLTQNKSTLAVHYIVYYIGKSTYILLILGIKFKGYKCSKSRNAGECAGIAAA